MPAKRRDGEAPDSPAGQIAAIIGTATSAKLFRGKVHTALGDPTVARAPAASRVAQRLAGSTMPTVAPVRRASRRKMVLMSV
jgi:hypothetical protein